MHLGQGTVADFSSLVCPFDLFLFAFKLLRPPDSTGYCSEMKLAASLSPL